MLLVGLLCLPAVPSADTAQYFYDELGRRVGNVPVFVPSPVDNDCGAITARVAH